MAVKRSDVVRAVVVRTTKAISREGGMFIKFDQNAAVIINADGSPRGSLSFPFSLYFFYFYYFFRIFLFF